MANRINKWWNEVMEWKERFEKQFPSDFIKGRTFRSAELKRLERILAYPGKKLTEDERLSQRMVYSEHYRELEKSLYPNPIIRLIRNVGKFAEAGLMWTAERVRNMFAKPRPVSTLKDSDIRKFLKDSIQESSKVDKRNVASVKSDNQISTGEKNKEDIKRNNMSVIKPPNNRRNKTRAIRRK